jgi:hypothetical protein
MDFEFGSLYMQTFKKLPIQIPKMNVMLTIIITGIYGIESKFCKSLWRNLFENRDAVSEISTLIL